MDSQRDEVYSERVRCGKRTYFIDVKPTHSGRDFFITISESRKVGGKFEKHKIYLYKEDFSKFSDALTRSMSEVARFLAEVGPEPFDDGPRFLEDELPEEPPAEMRDDFRDLTVDDRES